MMQKAQEVLKWLRHDSTGRQLALGFAVVVLMLLVMVLRSQLMAYVSPDGALAFIIELVANLWLPVVFYFMWLQWHSSSSSGAAEDKPQDMNLSRLGPLSFVRNTKLRSFMIILMVPALGWLNWAARKRMWAQQGPSVNATVSVIMASRDFLKSLASLVLLPLVSMVTAAHAADDATRMLQVLGTGLGLGIVAGLVVLLCAVTFAPFILGLFEGREPLLPEKVLIFRCAMTALPSAVINDALMGVLAGTYHHMLIGECMAPCAMIAVAITVMYRWWPDLVAFVIASVGNELLFLCFLSRTVLGFIAEKRQAARRARACEAATAAPPAASAPPPAEGRPEGRQRPLLAEAGGTAAKAGPWGALLALCRDLTPSEKVFREMLSASGSTGIRNMALRLKDLLCWMFASRLGNLESSTFTMQGTLTAYMAGPAGLSGYFTANIAPGVLENGAYGFFIKSLKGTLAFLLLIAGFWFYFAAYGGPESVLRQNGIAAGAQIATADWAANASPAAAGAFEDGSCSANITGEATGSRNCSANWTEISASGNATLSTLSMSGGSQDWHQEYLRVLTPLNHWLWALGTVANEIAAPFDGFLVVLGAYRSIGILYAVDFLFVLLPVLYVADHASEKRNCILPLDVGGCNLFTGVPLALLLWGLVRLAGTLVVVFGLEVSRLRRLQRKSAAACTKEVVLGYLKSRCQLSEEEVMAHRSAVQKDSLARFHAQGPMARWSAEHDTTAEALSDAFYKLQGDGNMDTKKAVDSFLLIWGDWM